jgi:hypothetical protein
LAVSPRVGWGHTAGAQRLNELHAGPDTRGALPPAQPAHFRTSSDDRSRLACRVQPDPTSHGTRWRYNHRVPRSARYALCLILRPTPHSTLWATSYATLIIIIPSEFTLSNSVDRNSAGAATITEELAGGQAPVGGPFRGTPIGLGCTGAPMGPRAQRGRGAGVCGHLLYGRLLPAPGEDRPSLALRSLRCPLLEPEARQAGYRNALSLPSGLEKLRRREASRGTACRRWLRASPAAPWRCARRWPGDPLARVPRAVRGSSRAVSLALSTGATDMQIRVYNSCIYLSICLHAYLNPRYEHRSRKSGLAATAPAIIAQESLEAWIAPRCDTSRSRDVS